MHSGRRADAVRRGDGETEECRGKPHAAAEAFSLRLIVEMLAFVVCRTGVDKRAHANLPEAERRSERNAQFRRTGDQRVADRRARGEPANIRHPAKQPSQVIGQRTAGVLPRCAGDEHSLADQPDIGARFDVGPRRPVTTAEPETIDCRTSEHGVACQHRIGPRIQDDVRAGVGEAVNPVEEGHVLPSTRRADTHGAREVALASNPDTAAILGPPEERMRQPCERRPCLEVRDRTGFERLVGLDRRAPGASPRQRERQLTARPDGIRDGQARPIGRPVAVLRGHDR